MQLKVNDWNIISVKYSKTYGGILCGIPNENDNDNIINSISRKISEIEGIKQSDINIIKDYSGYFDGTEEYDKCECALKPIVIQFSIFKYEPSIKASVITFAEESESPEDVIKRVIDSHSTSIISFKQHLKTTKWEF
jgi:hypothetical protein